MIQFGGRDTSFLYGRIHWWTFKKIGCGGVFYREFTKLNGFTGFTTLSVVHTHYLMLGMVFFLLLVVVEKNFHFVDNKVLKYLIFYHIVLILTVFLLTIRGVVQVLSLDVSSAVLSGIGHLILGISMVFVLISIRNCIKDSFWQYHII